MARNTSKQQGTKHNDSCTRAFANLSPLGCCPRCDELRAGSKPRIGWNDAVKAQEAANARAIVAHFAPGGKHQQIVRAGGIDTAFEW
jgi:hypothetical protein